MKLAFRKIGEGTKNLIVCHGIFGSSDNWLTVSKLFSPNYTVWLLDMRNHGKSPHSPEHTHTAMASDIKEFIADHNLEGTVLLGHSMGGKAVMEFALHHEALISQLVVVDIAPRFYGKHHDSILAGLAAINLTTLVHRQEAEAVLSQYVKETDTRQFLLKNLYRKEDGGFGWRINLPILTAAIENIGESLPENAVINLPTLFIRGELSYYIRDTDLPLIKNIFPHYQLVTISNAGHWVQAEQPKAFAEALNTFIG
jgi:esterase